MVNTELARATGLSVGAAYKAPVFVATTANITLSGEQTIDGEVTDESRVLVKNQTDAGDNGIWISSAGDWERAPDLSNNNSIRKGTRVWVTDGTVGGNLEFVMISDNPIDIGTDDQNWTRAVDLTPSADFGTAIHAAASKATPVDADEVGIWDSVTTALGKLTWANLKTTLFTALGALLAAATSKSTPVDADSLLLSDSAASDATKKLTWSNVKATMFAAMGVLIAATTNKSTPVDADGLLIYDSAASSANKRLTWANLKATLKTYFDTLYASGSVTLAAGTYTPTLTNVTNIAASVAAVTTYSRVGATVTVAGTVQIDPTATGQIELGISLPVASNFAATTNAGGTAVDRTSAGGPQYGAIDADSTNDRVALKAEAASGNNRTWSFIFAYQVI